MRVDISRKNGMKYEHITDLLVTGTGYIHNGTTLLDPIEERYDFDIDEIKYDGKNIYPIMEVLGGLDDIEAACFHHIHHLFTGQESKYQIPEFYKEPSPAKIIRFELKRKIN